jgi:fructokinase
MVFGIEHQFGEACSVGIATPGSLSRRTGLIRNANSVVLNGKPLDVDLSAALKRPVRLENDANCFALSEATDGAAQSVETVFGVILGSGVGGGLVVRRRAIVGRNRVAGEWGHNPMPWPRTDEQPGLSCYCGKSGCIETFLSGPGLAAHFQSATGQALSAREIAEAAEATDPAAMAALELFEDRLARGLAHVINIFDPDMIVLGGGLSNIKRFYQALPRLIPRYVFSDAIDTPILPAVHGDSSGVRGAAFLWPVRPEDLSGSG